MEYWIRSSLYHFALIGLLYAVSITFTPNQYWNESFNSVVYIFPFSQQNTSIAHQNKAKQLSPLKNKEIAQFSSHSEMSDTESTPLNYIMNISKAPLQPDYPLLSKKLGEEGEVILKMKLNSLGEVKEVILQKSSGFSRLDKSAISAATKAYFPEEAKKSTEKLISVLFQIK